jgi:hypothetical protein
MAGLKPCATIGIFTAGPEVLHDNRIFQQTEVLRHNGASRQD